MLGLGRLGSPLAASFAKAGLRVTGYDLDPKKVLAINSGLAPVQEPGLQDAIRNAGPLLKATTEPDQAVEGTQACICVAPTPSWPDGSFDNQYLLNGIERLVSAVCRHGSIAGGYLFVIASTVTPGSCEKVFLPLLRRQKILIQLAYKPELIALGSVMEDLAHPDVALVGSTDSNATAQTARLYARLYTHPVKFKLMSFVEAELAKISLNCAVTMKISFANQLSMVAQHLGADPRVILDCIGQDSRIGSKALKPGMPYGGPCFPRDNRMFGYVAERAGVYPHLSIATDRINKDIIQFVLAQIPEEGDIGILGLAYKPGTPIAEESFGSALSVALMEKGRVVKCHDPLLCPNQKSAFDCSIVIITMDSPEYRRLRFRPEQFIIDPIAVVETRQTIRRFSTAS